MINVWQSRRRLRIRFSLRVLFLVSAAVAVCCWSYWTAWPRWQMRRDQAQFEKAAQRIKKGDLIYDMWGRLGWHERGVRGVSSDRQDNPIGWIQYEWPNGVYLIYCPLERRAGGNPNYDLSQRVEVFRLPPAPRGYEPHTARGRQALPDRAYAYSRDFFEFIAGDRQNNPGFEYDLIYSN